MPSTPELQQTDPYLAEIEGFRTMARLHGVPTGTPECVASLPLRLAQDWRLRGNFVELLRELQRKDPEFSLPDALAVLLLAVGGPKASPNRSRLLDEPIDLTAGFLASLGGWPGSDEEPITDLDHPSDLDPRLDPLYAADAQQPPEPTPTQEPELADREEPELAASEEPEPARPETPAGISLAEITQALARLERGSVDLRLHLDSIDQRLSRMEPLLESPALTQTEPPASPARNTPQTDSPARPRPAEVLIDPNQPATPPIAAAKHPLPPDPSQERDLVHRDDLPPAISPTPQPSPHSTNETPGAPQSSIGSALPPHSRPLTPRRDRFAAAMDLPGTRTALNFPAREEALHFPQTPALSDSSDKENAAPAQKPASNPLTPFETPADTTTSVEPEANATPPALGPKTDETVAGSTSSDPKLSSVFVPLASVQPAATDRPVPAADPAPAPPPQEITAQASAVPAALTAATPSTPVPPDILSALSAMGSGELPPLRPAPSFTLGGAVAEVTPSAATETADESELEHTSRGPLVLGLVSAFLIALAAFLLLRGKPLPFLFDQPKPVASLTAPKPASPQAAVPTPASRFDSQPRNNPPSASFAISRSVTHATPPSTAAPSSTDRVLPARQTTQPAASEQILATPTFVPEAVMKARLLSAPPPLYPKLANAVGLEGGIIFEAIIAKDGSVEGLTPLGGQRLLRDAAANAVRQWHYQPFLLHGEPVEVRSIIHVNVIPPAGDASASQ